MWLLLAASALAGPADDAYLEALEAWEQGNLPAALARSEAALEIDPDHAPARLVHGYALTRSGRWEAGLDEIRPLVADPDVGLHAQYWVRRFDHRWERTAPALSLSLLLHDDRDPDWTAWVPGLAVGVDVPIAPWLGLRADVKTPRDTYDELGLDGPVGGVQGIVRHTVGAWAVEGGLGPSLWFGRVSYFGRDFPGPFPGLRASVATDHRFTRLYGLRFEVGYDHHWGARQFLGGLSSGGVDFRLSWVFWIEGRDG